MNEAEIMKDLRSKVKPYQGFIEQGTFSNTMIRYEMGRLKPSTLIAFLNKLGYIKENGLWIKDPNFKPAKKPQND